MSPCASGVSCLPLASPARARSRKNAPAGVRRNGTRVALGLGAGVVLGSWLTLGALVWRDRAPVAAASTVMPTAGADEKPAAPAAIHDSVASRPSNLDPPQTPLTPAPTTSAQLPPAQEALQLSAFIWGDGVYGAGFLISDHHVLTCFHVVEDMKTVKLSIAEGPAIEAKLVAHDRALDLAVLFVEQAQPRYARLRSALEARMGDSVFGMGAPHKMTFSLSRGIVSYVGRRYAGQYYLQTDVATNAGSSGGPLLDENGAVLAVASFILRDSQGLAFALPIDYAYQRFPQFFADELDTSKFDSWLHEHDEPSP